MTNAVKHFRYKARGKRRIHQRPAAEHLAPDAEHLAACRPWLTAELAVVKPDVLGCLGAVAAQELLGPSVRVTRDRGRRLDAPSLAPAALVTAHPSSILRSRDKTERDSAFNALVDDLRAAACLLRPNR